MLSRHLALYVASLLVVLAAILPISRAPVGRHQHYPTSAQAAEPTKTSTLKSERRAHDPTPLLTIPSAVSGDVGDFIEIPATTVGKSVQWVVLDKGLKMFPLNLLKDTKTCVVYSSTAGAYKVLAYTASPDGDPSPPSYCVVTIGTPPPGPGPGPGPTPTNPLTATFQAAYALDTDTDRAASLAFLQSAYKGMAAQAASRTETTNAGFVAWMKSVVEAPGVGLTAVQVKNLRTAIGAELSSAWGATSKPLAAADAAKELSKISDALAGVK